MATRLRAGPATNAKIFALVVLFLASLLAAAYHLATRNHLAVDRVAQVEAGAPPSHTPHAASAHECRATQPAVAFALEAPPPPTLPPLA